MLCLLLCSMFAFFRLICPSGMGTMQNGNMGPGRGGAVGVHGHFNPAFMQGGGHGTLDGPRKRHRVDESG